jgi:hypothetical protein
MDPINQDNIASGFGFDWHVSEPDSCLYYNALESLVPFNFSSEESSWLSNAIHADVSNQVYRSPPMMQETLLESISADPCSFDTLENEQLRLCNICNNSVYICAIIKSPACLPDSTCEVLPDLSTGMNLQLSQNLTMTSLDVPNCGNEVSMNSHMEMCELLERTMIEPAQSARPSTTTTQKKSRRTKITNAARDVLESHFRTNPYPDKAEMSALHKATQLKSQVIKTWFSNARSRKARQYYDVGHSEGMS